MKYRWIPIFLFLILSESLFGFSPIAVELNKQGYQLYLEERYEEAIEYFYKSFTEDDSYYYAHYNYACTLSILFGKRRCAWVSAVGAIFDHLKVAISLNPDYIDKMKTDKDLDSIRYSYRYYAILGLDPNVDEELFKILTNVNWYGPDPGTLPPVFGIDFKEDNTVDFWIANVDANFNIETVHTNGTYSINGGNIRVDLDHCLPTNEIIKVSLGYNFEIINNLNGRLVDGKLSFDEIPCSLIDWDGSCDV